MSWSLSASVEDSGEEIHRRKGEKIEKRNSMVRKGLKRRKNRFNYGVKGNRYVRKREVLNGQNTSLAISTAT
jgi:IS1 family transposase